LSDAKPGKLRYRQWKVQLLLDGVVNDDRLQHDALPNNLCSSFCNFWATRRYPW